MQSKLSILMADQKMTIRDLVKKTGISSATIQKARDNRIEQCRVGSLKKIAEALGVRVQDLFEEIDLSKEERDD
jgi:DNA-binding Xre family transcriptional regulator